jgi:biotin operon repressor
VTLRGRIVALLADGRERTGDEIAERLGVSRERTVAVLKLLIQCGEITSSYIGCQRIRGYRSVRPPAKRQGGAQASQEGRRGALAAARCHPPANPQRQLRAN